MGLRNLEALVCPQDQRIAETTKLSPDPKAENREPSPIMKGPYKHHAAA